MENLMMEYLEEKYDKDNHIMNWLNYWSKGGEPPKGKKEKEEWRKINDLDCLYLEGDLNADLIISIWQILKMVVNCIHKDNFNGKNNDNIKCLIENFDDYFPKDNEQNKELVEKLEELCKKAELRSNVMRLPDGGRRIQLRGAWYADQIPPTLYQCFEGGSFSKYFKDENELKAWIKEQNLEIAFIDKKITKDNIKPISERFPLDRCIKNPKDHKLISELLDYSISFLNERSKIIE